MDANTTKNTTTTEIDSECGKIYVVMGTDDSPHFAVMWGRGGSCHSAIGSLLSGLGKAVAKEHPKDWRKRMDAILSYAGDCPNAKYWHGHKCGSCFDMIRRVVNGEVK